MKYGRQESYGQEETVSVNTGATDFLEVLTKTEDSVVEAVRVKNAQILATMWHPERESVFVRDDIERVRRLFEKRINLARQ